MINKISIFKNNDDYIKNLTNDRIINITGEIGSSISTFGHSQRNNKKYIVINMDKIFYSRANLNNDEQIVSKAKYDNIVDLYNIIVKYINDKNKFGIIEGNTISYIKKIQFLKGKIIVKRDSVYSCFSNSIKEDNQNREKMFFSIMNRVAIFKTYKDIEKYIVLLEVFQNKTSN